MNAKEAREIYEQNKHKREGVAPFLKIIKDRALDGYSFVEFRTLEMGVDDCKSLEEMGYVIVMPRDPSRTATIKITR